MKQHKKLYNCLFKLVCALDNYEKETFGVCLLIGFYITHGGNSSVKTDEILTARGIAV